MVAQPFHRVGTVLGRQVYCVGNLGFICEGGVFFRRARCGIHMGCLGRPSRLSPSRRIAASDQQAGGQGQGQRQSDLLFHFSISFVFPILRQSAVK